LTRFSRLSSASIAPDLYHWPIAAVAGGAQSGDSSQSSWLLYTCAAGLIEGVSVVQAIAERNFTAEHLVMGLAKL
jgi:hypothetical protein